MFDISKGSVVGTRHSKPGKPGYKNNQDACEVLRGQDADGNVITVGIVCDGCGSGEYSEVGSRWGARVISSTLLTALLKNKIENQSDVESVLDTAHENVLFDLAYLLKQLTGDFATNDSFKMIARDYLLFTTVGFFITPTFAALFTIGDGTVALNGEVTNIEPDDGNKPPYITYEVLRRLTGDAVISPERTKFNIVKVAPTDTVETLLVASDGVDDLELNRMKMLPRGGEVGGIEQFWTEDMFQPLGVQRRLNLINNDKTTLNRTSGELSKFRGYLTDDTTIISVRKNGE